MTDAEFNVMSDINRSVAEICRHLQNQEKASQEFKELLSCIIDILERNEDVVRNNI